MYFGSDNAGPVPDQIIEALKAANTGYQRAYGRDTIMAQVRSSLREIFEAPEAAVYLVGTGTAANALALATLSQPWQTIFCSPVSHIQEDECNAPEFFSSGAKLTLIKCDDKITPDALRAAVVTQGNRGVHGAQRGPLSLTQTTEKGTLYSLKELRALTEITKSYEIPVHMDGARFANALVSLGCSAADMTWKSGIDALSFGGTKNGLMGVEAVIFFDPKHAWEFELRRKRSAHLFSKTRYLAAQMQGYLKNDLWLDLARKANANASYLARGLRQMPHVGFAYEPQANMMFVRLSRADHQKANQAGANYSLLNSDLDTGPPDEILTAHFVCDWSIEKHEIDMFLDIMRDI